MTAQTTALTAAERARNGAEFLDSLLPGWYTRIDVEELDIAQEQDCILGQLGFWREWITGVPPVHLTANGFLGSYGNEPLFSGRSPYEVDCEWLTEAWQDEINRRWDEGEKRIDQFTDQELVGSVLVGHISVTD